MLSTEERQQIEAVMHQYGTMRAVVPEALMIVREHRGWVSDEQLRDVAALLEIAPAEVESIATFYNQIYRKPVGRHVILVCDSVSCWIMGYNSVREFLSAKLNVSLGETTADGRFTLLPSVCLGACDHAPAMMIDHELFLDLTPEKIDAILDGFK